MNSGILNIDIQRFIENNLKSDITSLVLKGSPFEHVSVQELANQIVAKQKSEKKLPNWFTTSNIYYPSALSIEQTSSEITANYKASLINGGSVIDITGGFGIDCYYFSKQFKKVIHCEINSELSEIVTHNYKQLATNNINTVADDGLVFLKNSNEEYDWIYIDPSRRNDIKGKVFLLNDCLPNVPENLDFLFSKSNNILIKNSPMLDITSTINELRFVKEIHIVGVDNEVKELLFLLEKDYAGEIEIITKNILKKGTESFHFTYKSNASSEYSEPLSYLYEPNSAILKSGAFHHISEQFNLKKLHEHSHLYTSDNQIDFPGRVFKVLDYFKYDKKLIKRNINEEKANISVRNFSKSVAIIRKETKLKDGGDLYLFCTKTINKKQIVIKTVKTS